jgi:hypothetical protein
VTLLLPYGMNAALNTHKLPRPPARSAEDWAALGKAAERAKAAEPSAAERAAAIGKMLQSGELRAGSGGGMNARFGGNAAGGPVTKAALAKFGSGERPAVTDRPDRDWLDKQVAAYIAKAPGVNPVNGRVMGAFGNGARMTKAIGDGHGATRSPPLAGFHAAPLDAAAARP